ncbi:MAG: hypothetical protein WC346_21575 [Methanogenium sp.]|jgi:hypothetical protein
MDQRISEFTPISSGSISSTGSLIELVQGINNYKTTPKDLVQSTLPISIDSLTIISSGSTASNVGTGTGEVYKEKVGNDLRFKTIKAGTNITVSNDTDEITINSTASGSTSGSLPSLKSFTLNEDMSVKDQVVILSNGNIRKLQYDSFGVASVFNSGDCAGGINLAKLNDNKFIVSYANSAGGSSNTAVKIGTVSSDYVVSYGSEYVVYQVSSTNPWEHYVLPFTDSKFVVHYRNNDTDPNKGGAKIGTISGGAISFGTTTLFGTGDSGGGGVTYRLVKLNDTRYLTVSRTAFPDVFIGNVTGSIINFGSRYTFDTTGYFKDPDAIALNSSKFVISYTRYPTGSLTSGSGSLKVGIVDENNILFGNISSFNFGHYDQFSSISPLNESAFVLGYSDSDTSGVVRICNVDVDEISLGGPYIFSSSSVTNKKVVCLDQDKFVIFYNKGGTTNLRMGTISGSIISFPMEEHPLTDNIYDAIRLNDSTVVIGDVEGGTNNGYTKAGPISTFTISDRIAGILQEGGTTGQSKPVAVFGDVSTVHTGLIPGNLYYYDTATGNDVIPAPVGLLAGFALSSTELKIVSY